MQHLNIVPDRSRADFTYFTLFTQNVNLYFDLWQKACKSDIPTNLSGAKQAKLIFLNIVSIAIDHILACYVNI